MNEGKICVSVAAETADAMIADIRRAAEFADVIEVRFDCLDAAEIHGIVDNLPEINGTYLFTFRPKEQGGKRDLTLADRLKFWELIFSRPRPNFMIDLEAETSILLAIKPNAIKRIVSQHYFDGVPDDLAPSRDVLAGFGDNIVKIAIASDDIVDAIPVWKLINNAKESGNQVIPIAMGEAGKWTRILGLAHGAFMTYASLDAGKETADGQLTAKDLIEVYRVKELDEDARVYGVIGDPVSQSLSPYMHNPALAAAGENAVFMHLLVKNLDEFMGRMVRRETREVELNFGGFSVTMPHKQSIMKHLDEIDPTAEQIGAVNTVRIEGGKLTGYNTDAHGFITPLKATFGDLRGSRVAIFGAGGAARACVFALRNEDADVSVFVRDPAKAEAFADEFGVELLSISDFKDQLSKTKGEGRKTGLSGFDIVVDATPLGMTGPLENETLFSADELLGVRFVYDLVTKPTDTPLICEAKKAGIPAIGGVEMLIAQGARQFEIWTGLEAPIKLMRDSLLARMNG